MDPDYNSACSAGYRDVALNIRIVNNETKDLGIETHVCEVQLLLKAFAQLKVPSTMHITLFAIRISLSEL
jgi:hypothetical protein